MKGVDIHIVGRLRGWRLLGKSIKQNGPTNFSIPANGITALATLGISMPLSGAQMIRVLQYFFNTGDPNSTGQLFATSQWAIDLQSGSNVLAEFSSGAMLDSSILQAAPAAKGQLLYQTRVGISVEDYWINYDDFSALGLGALSSVTLAGKQSIENNDSVNAHNVAYFESCIWETWEKDQFQ